jgi:monofunctional biosynthetic peptidoglycan transglycosylase
MAIEAKTRRRSRAKGRHPWLWRAGQVLLLGLAALLLSVVVFRFVNPPFTPVMVVEKLRGTTLKHRWVPLEQISRNLPLAVIASEDGRFCEHWGVDWGAVREAAKERRRGGLRGASTITMQTAKNLYLWTWRSYVRKVLEVPLAYLLTIVWPKDRVMEVYLNIAQWGPGIFGAEAASRHYFGKSAAALTRHEALLLAAALPSPKLRNPGKPSARMLAIARSVEQRMPVIAARAGCALPPAQIRQSTSGQRALQPL